MKKQLLKNLSVNEINTHSSVRGKSAPSFEKSVKESLVSTNQNIKQNLLLSAHNERHIMIHEKTRKRSKSVSWSDGGDDIKKIVHQTKYHSTENVRRDKNESMQTKVTINLNNTKYKLVAQIALELGLHVTHNTVDDNNIIWSDGAISFDKICQLKSNQHFNHLPGLKIICNKQFMSKYISMFRNNNSNDWHFFNKIWKLPEQWKEFENYSMKLNEQNRKRYFIFKRTAPNNSLKYHQIIPSDDLSNLSNKHGLIDEYISNPLLIHNKKFHLRFYALLTSVNPLRIYLYHDGLVYMALQNYSYQNMSDLKAHITKQSDNKSKHDQFVFTVHKFEEYLFSKKIDKSHLWYQINDIVIKTILISHPDLSLAHNICRPFDELGGKVASDNVCFELLAYDTMFDENCKLWLLSVHQSPSLKIHNEVESNVKRELITSLLKLIQKFVLKSSHVKRKLKEKDVDNKISEVTNSLMQKNKWKAQIVKLFKQIAGKLMSETLNKKQVVSKTFKMIFPCENSQTMGFYLKILKQVYLFYESTFNERDFKIYLERRKLILVQMKKTLSKESQIAKLKKEIKLTEEQKEILKVYLNMIHLKVPGLSDKKSIDLLSKVQENWTEMRQEVAEFWFSNLNIQKQKQVIEIVNNKIEFILVCRCRVLEPHNVCFTRICKRIFNLLLSNHGSGLWDCFVEGRNSKWENILRTSSMGMSNSEMESYRRVVQLCCQSLLIVFVCCRKK